MSFFSALHTKKVCLGWLLAPLSLSAQMATDTAKNVDLQQVTITATMAGSNTPMTFTNIGKEQIRRNNFGQDVPFLLKNTPSVVETSDAGAGIGYTSLRIRGTDMTRINVTIDGVPLNDPESQAVYWVNMPDFMGSTSGIQIQRGVGTSTNGASAFGATVNLTTNGASTEKYIRYDGAVGSFNTLKNSVSFASGLLGRHISVEGRVSRITSDGFVDRASSKLGSAYLSAHYLGQKTSVKFKVFTGNERTYQAWYGLPAQFLETNRTYNPAGTEKADAPYENQVDDYGQTHAHLALNHVFSPKWRLTAALHYTKGRGFYEEYKARQVLKSYLVNRTTNDTTDLVRRLWLDNDFYGGVYALTYENSRFQNILGGGYNIYDGKHFGEVIQAYGLPNWQTQRYYDNVGLKTDFNIYDKINYAFSDRWNGFLDIQYRHVSYKTEGLDRKRRDIGRDLTYNFVNPKLGLVFNQTALSQFYASFAVAHREPNRNDVLDAVSTQTPQYEQLLNTEIGWKYATDRQNINLNIYHMHYNNQLALTGQINDVGEAVRVNVPKSYRLGVELSYTQALTQRLSLSGNATVSANKILNFTEYRDNWDTGLQDTIRHGQTDLAFSPNFVGNIGLTYAVLKAAQHDLQIGFNTKFVGKQYIDNTSSAYAQLAAFNYTDAQLFYTVRRGWLKYLTFKASLNNIFNQKFVNNAWVYRFASAGYDPRPDDPYARAEQGSVYNLTGFFPQAGRNVLVGLSVQF